MRSLAVLAIVVVAFASRAQQPDSARRADWPRVPDDIEVFAVAARLPDLRLGPHVPGDRELRVWIGGGLTWPQGLYRMVEHDGRVTGQYIRYWHREDSASSPIGSSWQVEMRYWERGRCGPVTQSPEAEACVARFVSKPPWQMIWRTIDSLGVWVLPDSRTLKGGYWVLDGWGITVESWDGAAYRLWEYSSPDGQPWPEAKRAAMIAHAFDTVGRLMKPNVAEGPRRGKLETRADTLEFSDCDGSGPYYFAGYLDSLIAVTGRGDSTKRYRLTTPYYVEILAVQEPDFVVREWYELSPYYVGALEARVIRHIRPWAPELCKH